MNFSIHSTDFFEKELIRLSKKHHSIKTDFKSLLDSLKDTPKLGIPLVKISIKSECLSVPKEKVKAEVVE